MNDRLGMMTMQPDAARSMLGEMSDWERLGFDLNMPDSAPDEHKRAAARRISSVLEVPDSTGDGRLWRRNKARFKSGAEYLDTLRETVRKGNIWELAASEELQEFDAADRERRVQMARKAQGMLGRGFRAVAGAVKHRYGLEDGNAYLRDAPEEIVAANARLREDNRLQSDAMLKMAIEAETLGMEPAGSRTPPRERKAMRSDRELMAKWYQQRDEDALVDEYAQKLFDQHFALVWMHLAPQLSDAAREMVERGLKEQKLRGKDILDFQLLDEQEQEIAARLLRLSRDPVEGGFWNTLGDAGVGFVNGVVSIPQNVTRQVRKGIDQYIFGVNSSVEDMEEKNRWARMEQRLYEALDDYPLLDPSGADHWYPARAVIGAISTLPYMGYAALPFGAGLVMVALDFGERMDAQIARGGEDVYGRGVEWDAFKLLMGGVYAVTERLQADRLLAGGDMSLRIALATFGKEGGWQAAKAVGQAWAVDTTVESFQEGLQESVEEITRQVGMREGVNAEAVIKAGVDEFVETLGTMGILSAVGMGRRAKWERSVTGRKALVDEVAGVLQRNSFLQSDNPYKQKAPVSATLAAEADVAARVHELRQAWQDGGAEGLQRNRLSVEQADFLDGVFRAEQVQQEVEQEIRERNMEIAQEADASGAVPVPVTVVRVVAVVEGDRASADERLQEMGFSEAGAAKIARWVDGVRLQEKRQADLRDTIRQALAHKWQRGEGLADARDDAMQLAAELDRLRAMYQRSGTEAQAAKVFERAGFGSELATKLAALFAAEHKFATSPDAAAAFRALYLGQSVDMTLAERAQRMSGWEQVQEGDGVFRMRRRDAQGSVVADVAVRQQDVVEFDPEGEYAGEAVELVFGGAMTAEMWRGMSADERRAWADQHRISAQGGFVLRSGFKGEEAQEASEEQARVLLGEIMIQTGVSSATIYHEAVHAWAAMMRQSGMMSDADIKKLQERYGVSATDAGWFNEEALADDIQEIGAASDYRPEQGLAARFMAVVRSLTGRARAQETRQMAAQGARRTLFENIVYGTDWEGVGEFAEVVRKKEERGADPLEGVGSKQAETGTVKAGKVVDSPTPQTAPRRAPPPARKDDTWSAATPQGNVRVGGKWIIAPRNRFISDTDMERYDFSLQGRTRDATRGSSEQVQRIATEAEFDPLRLMDSSDIATGAPIAIRVEMQNDQGKMETYYMVLSGNGRFRALDIVDADHRGDTYRNPIRKFADERGIAYNESDMTAEAQPRLVRVLTRKPVGVTYQRIAELSNQDVVLRMTDAERASADAELIRSHGKADLYNANRDGTASKSGSNEFMYWFVGATGDAGLVDSKGNLTDAARLRARNAMLALIIGQGQKGKESVAAFIEQAEALGLERQRDAILMAAGELSALGELKPEYELAQEFSVAAVAMLEIARARKAGKKVDAESYLAQGDMFEKHSPAFGSILRLLDGGRSTEWMAGVLRRYAELVGKIDTTTQDIFGVELASKAELLEQAKGQQIHVAERGADMRYSLAAREMAPSELSTSQESPALKGAGDIRYALDWRGAAYGKEHTLTAFMAHAVLTGQPVPSARTMTMLAQRIGVENINYPQMSRDAQRMARETSDRAILRAAQSGDPQLAAYAIGEMARQEQERRLVREGAKAGDKLARARERIRSLSDAERMKAMRDLTGADMADMEADIDVDLAATILAAEPAKFAPQEDKKPEAAFAKAEGGEAQVGRNDTDEDAPELTDKQRAEIARRRREREARIQEMLDAAKQRGDVERARALERKLRRKGEQRVAAQEGVESTTADSSARAGAVADVDIAGEKMPIALADKWEAAALMRVWAFERWKRENPLRMGEQRDVSKDRVAVEFYRKTLTRTLKDMARKLLAPGYAREVVLGYIADITAGQTANMMERKSAYILGLLNRYAIREERKSLVQKFRREIKRQFVKGEHFEELGLDLDRVIRGQVEEDARYVMRVCEMTGDAAADNVSALEKERRKLEAIIAGRMGMTDEDGNALAVGDDDMSLLRAMRQLALLDTYGGMINMMPGEILDLQGHALADFGREAVALAERWQEMDAIVRSIRDPLVRSIMRDEGDPRVAKPGVVGRMVDSLIGMLRIRLDNLTRYEKDPARREAAREAIGEIMDLLARGHTDYVNQINDAQAALAYMLGRIHRKADGTPDRKAMRKYLRSLDEKIPVELARQLTRQGNHDMTKGEMLQLLVYLDQWASYAHNIKKHDRVGQAALIRNFVYEDPRTGEMRRVYTPEDAQLLEWLRRQHYTDQRGPISAVTERIAGREVDSPDPLFTPMRMYQKRTEGTSGRIQGGWQPLSGVFSRRVRHGLDVDESVSILDMFYDRAHETALLTSYTERGIIIREVLTSIQFQDAVRRFFGPAELKKILSQVTQSLNAGKKPGEYRDPAANLARRVMTYIALGWNMLTPLKQTTSLPVWANRVGFKNFFRYLTNIDRQAIREMNESDENRVRWGTGPMSGMSPAEQAAYDAPLDSRAKKFFGDWGLWANRRADWLVSVVIGQGLYRDLTVKYMDQGMSETAAKRRAMSETFSMIEETQSSTRTENAPALRREGGMIGSGVTQFAITPLLQIQYELASFREWRDLVKNNGPEHNIREARNRYMRALFLNHVVVPAAILFVTGLYKAMTGDEPDWKKDGYWQTVLVAVLIGQFSRIFFVGAFTESILNAFIKREVPRAGGQLIPSEGVISFGANMMFPIRDIVTWDMDNFQRDLKRAARSTAITRLPVKLYENYIED